MTEIVSKPDHGARLTNEDKATVGFQSYLDEIQLQLNANLLGAQVTLTSYTVAELPEVTSFPGMIFVSDETGGAVMAFSDGSNWLRCTDRTVVS